MTYGTMDHRVVIYDSYVCTHSLASPSWIQECHILVCIITFIEFNTWYLVPRTFNIILKLKNIPDSQSA